MKDKEMIEEISKILDLYSGCSSYNKAYNIANALYLQGYRKLTEDSVVLSKFEKEKLLHEMYEQGKFDALADLEKEGKVVLSREEYELLVECSSYEGVMKALKNEYKRGSKETAEKFAEKLKLRLFEYMDNDVSYKEFCKANVVCGEIDELAKQFGVEIKER